MGNCKIKTVAYVVTFVNPSPPLAFAASLIISWKVLGSDPPIPKTATPHSLDFVGPKDVNSVDGRMGKFDPDTAPGIVWNRHPDRKLTARRKLTTLTALLLHFIAYLLFCVASQVELCKYP